jgi:hypothetical protein
MKNIDRWFILIGLLYGTFGFAFGNLGRHQRALRAGACARPYQPDRALPRRCCSACSTGAFLALATSRLGGDLLSSISALWCVLVSIPLAQAHQTVALAAGGSLTVLAGMLTFLANYLLNVFSKSKSSAPT